MVAYCFRFFWSILVIPAESVRYAHFDVTGAIANGRRVKPADLDAAVDAYKLIGSAGICMPGIREQLANLLFRRGTTYRQLNEVDEAVADLEQADTIVRSLLACSPFESNQWLSLAIIDAKRRGGWRQNLRDSQHVLPNRTTGGLDYSSAYGVHRNHCSLPA
jgi:hypothetical protein